MKQQPTSSLSLLILSLVFAASSHSATMTQDAFVGHSNISDPDIACVSGGGNPICGITKYFGVSPINAGLGFFFDRFDTTLGTLEDVTLSYNLETGGNWIGRPENSAFSVSTDFDFRSKVVLRSDHFGDKSNVDDVTPTWTGRSESVLTSSADLIDGGETFTTFNSRIDQKTVGWAINLSGSTTSSPGDEFLYTPGVDSTALESNVQVILVYFLSAALDGRALDCEVGTAPCGATNRITFLSKAKISLTYDYEPATPVPVPAAWMLFVCGIFSLRLVRLKRGAAK